MFGMLIFMIVALLAFVAMFAAGVDFFTHKTVGDFLIFMLWATVFIAVQASLVGSAVVYALHVVAKREAANKATTADADKQVAGI